MFDVVAAAAGRRWTTELELLAGILEQLSVMHVAWLAAHVDKGTRLPEPIRVPRPDAAVGEPRRPARVGLAEFALIAGKPIEPPRREVSANGR